MTHQQQLRRRVGRLEQMRARTKSEPHTMEAESSKLKPRQLEVFQSHQRFRILVAGRRFGKTFFSALVELSKAACKRGGFMVCWADL